MTDDLDALIARIDAELEEPPPDDEWNDDPTDDEQRRAATAPVEDLGVLETVDGWVPPPLALSTEPYDIHYALAVLEGTARRPHRPLTAAETANARRILLDIGYDDHDPADHDGVLEAMVAEEEEIRPDAMEVRESQGRLGYRWL